MHTSGLNGQFRPMNVLGCVREAKNREDVVGPYASILSMLHVKIDETQRVLAFVYSESQYKRAEIHRLRLLAPYILVDA